MRKADYSDFTWKKDKLYLGNVLWGEVLPHPSIKGMWIIRWKGNGEFSTDYWNKARTKDNFVKMAQFLNNLGVEQAENT